MEYDFKIQRSVALPVKAGISNALVDGEPIEQIFADIGEWVRSAQQVDDSTAAPLFRGSFLPEGYRRSLLPPSHDAAPKNGLIPFDIEGDGDVEIKTRYALPVHFVTMRAMELVPGVRFFLKDETQGKDKEEGRDRTHSQKIYRINLSVGKIIQGIGRFLFDVPNDAELHERRLDDAYRCITPRNHVITKLRKRFPPKTSAEVLGIIEQNLKKPKQRLAYDSDEMVWLLKTLLALGDKWHWNELEDRLPSEAGRAFPVPL